MGDILLKFLNKHDFFLRIPVSVSEEMVHICEPLTLVDQISNALENGKYIIGIFLDFFRVFDT